MCFKSDFVPKSVVSFFFGLPLNCKTLNTQPKPQKEEYNGIDCLKKLISFNLCKQTYAAIKKHV